MSEASETERPLQLRLAEFVHWALSTGPWIGYDLDGGDIQEKALELGLTTRRKATEADCTGEHGIEFMMPGDDFHELAPEIRKLLGIDGGDP